MTSDHIQETLYQKYYIDDEFSEVTSSHWKSFGEKTKVVRINESFKTNAYGISTFLKKSPLRSLKHLPIDFLLSQMMLKYGAKKKTLQCAKSITNRLNILFDFDHAKHVLIYDLLNSYGLFNTKHLICIIGDGHGFFGTLIKTLRPKAKILFINLGRNLLIDVIYFSAVFPNKQMLLIQNSEEHKILENQEIYFLEAEHFVQMQNMNINLFINVASMQEMDMLVINRYFEYMRTSTEESYFYCCNRVEKTLPDGNIIRFADYPWEGGDREILLDEPCSFYQKYPRWHPPFWRPFDGLHRHRLVRFS